MILIRIPSRLALPRKTLNRIEDTKMRGKKGSSNSDGLANLSRISIYEPFL